MTLEEYILEKWKKAKTEEEKLEVIKRYLILKPLSNSQVSFKLKSNIRKA